MSIEEAIRALCESSISKNEMLVLFALALCGDRDGDNVSLRQSDIAQILGTSTENVKVLIGRLKRRTFNSGDRYAIKFIEQVTYGCKCHPSVYRDNFTQRIKAQTTKRDVAKTMTAEKPKLISAKEAAGITGLSSRTIARMCDNHEIPAVKLGNSWRINREKFMHLIGVIS